MCLIQSFLAFCCPDLWIIFWTERRKEEDYDEEVEEDLQDEVQCRLRCKYLKKLSKYVSRNSHKRFSISQFFPKYLVKFP